MEQLPSQKVMLELEAFIRQMEAKLGEKLDWGPASSASLSQVLKHYKVPVLRAWSLGFLILMAQPQTSVSTEHL